VQPAVAWMPWSSATFARAARERKPIYVNVAAGWCHWCHVMDEQTFGDPAVQELLAKRFVAIRVDADARPDLAERYQDFGWPANAFLTPDAEPVLELRGYQEPATFRQQLQDLADEAAAGRLQGRRAPPPPRPTAGSLEAVRDRVQARLDGFHDPVQGGWGAAQKYPFPAPVEQAFLRARLRGDAASRQRALLTLRGTLHLLDPVWGGVFQYSLGGVWTRPHFEKIALVQAGALESFTQAWQWTDDPIWARAAEQVRDYVLGFLLRPDAAFGTSQDADAHREDGGRVPGDEYYALDEVARRKAGDLRTDHNAYADWNGLLIHSFVRHATATGDDSSLDAGARAAATILRTHSEGNAFRHAASPDRILHLRDNAAMGRALLALHQATGQQAWLDRAEGTGTFLLDRLASPDGGFLAHTPDPDASGIFATPRRPLEENGLAIRFLVELAHLTPDQAFARKIRLAAETAARALAAPETIAPEAQIIGQFLMALETLTMEPLKLVVAGPRAAARHLHDAALRCPIPGRIVRWSRPADGYPEGNPAIFICRGNACSAPITSPATLPPGVARMLA
jgi:uncharacterized protein YyaL (SSP411 family)